MPAELHWTSAVHQLTEIVRGPRFGLFSDFDGTLCSFRPYPELPHLSDRNETLIVALSKKLPIISLISGRTAQELQEVVNLPGIVYVGNHGLEALTEDGQLKVLPEAQVWENRMTEFFKELGEPTLPGVKHQHKRITMSLTYRYAENPEMVRLLLKEKLDRLNEKYGFHLHEGRTIWEVRPPIPLNKGTAIASMIEEYKLDSAIYLGDDITDLPALEIIKDLRGQGRIRGLSIAVLGETDVPPVRETGDVIANSVEDVENVLNWILNHLPN